MRHPNRKQEYEQAMITDRQNRRKLLERLGGKCVRCGFSDWRALQIDHVHGDGNCCRARGRSFYLLEIFHKDPTSLQLLCANCNQIKRYEKGEGVSLRVAFISPSPTEHDLVLHSPS